MVTEDFPKIAYRVHNLNVMGAHFYCHGNRAHAAAFSVFGFRAA
jgi:hypothetical protein